MSIENNVKVTTKKLQKKYTSTSWGYLMDLILSSDEFNIALYQLMSDNSAGQKFIPKFNNIFRSFDLCPLDKTKVVIIGNVPSQSSADGLAFSEDTQNPFTKELSEITTYAGDKRSLEYLPQIEGVMLMNASLTAPIGKPNDHVPMWESITEQMIDQIGYKTNKTIFVFVGEETEHLSKHVRKGHYKFFLPSWNKASDEWDSSNFFNNVNELLKKINKEPINW